MTFPFGQTVTLVKRVKSGQDAFGNDVYSTTTVAVSGAFAPGGSSEQLQGQDVVITQPTVYLPAGTDVSAVDAIDVAGQRFEVDGSPNDWQNPFTGWRPGVEVKLRRVA
ncbi:MAG: hypothetical protein ACXVGG_07115 [Mycobacteriaceae bacterium]